MVPMDHAIVNAPAPLAESRAQKPGPSLADYAAVLARHKWLVVFLVTSAVLLTYLAITSEPAVYEGVLTLDLDRAASSGSVATQIQVLRSDAVLGPVAKRFGAKPGVEISHLEGSSLVRILCRAPNERLAAEGPVAVVAAYLEMQRLNSFNAWLGAAATAQARLGDLRAKMEESERALRAAESEPGGRGGKRRLGPVEQQLEETHARALADRLDKESAYDAVKSGALGALAASPEGDAIRKLLERKTEAQRKFADLQEIFGENHPDYQRSRAQLTALDGEIDRARMTAVESAFAELREARQREGALRKELSEARAAGMKSTAGLMKFEGAKQQSESDRALYDAMLRKIGEAQMEAKLKERTARIVDPVLVVAIDRHLKRKCVLAGVLTGLPLAFFLLLGSGLDHKLRRLGDLRAATAVPVLGVLPSVAEWPDPAGSPFAQAINSLRDGILTLTAGGTGKAVLVASPLASEGRSTMAANLAVSLARAGKRILLIDGDLRRPGLDKLLMNSSAEVGLSEVLDEGAAWQPLLLRPAAQPGLHLLPAGGPCNAYSASSQERREIGLRELLREAGKSYDLVLIDSPPFLHCPETVDLAKVVDAVVVTVRAGKTGEAAMHSMLGYLRRLNCRVAGIVMNDA